MGSVGLAGFASLAVCTSSAAPALEPLYAVALSSTVTAPAGLVFGRVLERGTRRPLEDAEVAIGDRVGLTDARGRFSIDGVAPGPRSVVASAHAHESEESIVTVEAGAEHRVSFHLPRKRFDPYEVVVRERAGTETTAKRSLDVEELTSAAGTYGDALRAVQNFPGTGRSAFGLGQLAVRGSPPRDTKVFFDGLEIPAVFHFDGLSSVINADTLSRVDFTPSNFGVRFGRATGGIVELEPRMGSSAPHGYMDVDLLDVTFLAEAEFQGGGVLVSGRRSWVDTMVALLLESLGEDLEIAPRTYDYQARYGHPFLGGEGSVAVLGSDDRFRLALGDDLRRERPTFSLHRGFHRLALSWRTAPGEDLALGVSASAGADFDEISVGDAYASDLFEWKTQARLEIERRWAIAGVAAGLDLELSRFEHRAVGPPPLGPESAVFRPDPLPDIPTARGLWDGGDTRGNLASAIERTAASPAAWAELRLTPWAPLSIVPGVRIDHHGLVDRRTIDPQIGAGVKLTGHLSLFGGAGLYSTPPPIGLLAKDLGNPNLSVERALHVTTGARAALPWSIDATLEAYAKRLMDLVVRAREPAPGEPVLENGGTGRAVGVELMLRRPFSERIFGWIAYALSRSERATVEGGPETLFAFDQTHVLTLVLGYRAEQDWTFSLRARYATGNPFTPVVGSVLDADTGAHVPIFAEETEERLSSFFQLDLRVDKEWVFQDVVAVAYVDVQNVTAYDNAEGWRYSFDYRERAPLRGLPLLPTAGLRLQF